MAAKDNFFVKNKSIITFLILEIVVLTAFNFGNISYIFGLAGAVLAIFGCLFAYKISGDKKEFLWLLLPVGILFLVSGIGAFGPNSKNFHPLLNISLLLSLPAFLILGFVTRKVNDVKPKTILMVVGGGLALITLFGLFSTLFQYGVFYSLIYKDTPNYYYNGLPYDITKEMYWLSGFEFTEVYIEYGSMFAMLCASFLPGLLFISPKRERNDFIICAAIGLIGLLTLLIIPNIKAIIVVALASSFAFIFKYLNGHKKAKKIIGCCFLGVVVLGVIFFIVALANAANGFMFKGVLDRIFVSNRIMANTKPVFQALFAKSNGESPNLFGLYMYSYTGSALYNGDDILKMETSIFEVELLKEVGLFGAFLFIGFIITMGYFVYRYIKHSEDSDSIKSILVVLLLSYFAFVSFSNAVIVVPHDEASYAPFLKSTTLLVVLFLFGYMFMPPTKKEVKEHE